MPPSPDSDPANESADAAADRTTISNLQPRLTTDGEIVDAHDGRIIKFGDQYYWYGTAYGTTNGFTTANEYHVYRSKDIVTWEHVGPALDVNTLASRRIRLRPQADFPYQLRLTEVGGGASKAYVSNGGPGPVIIPAQQTYVMEIPTAGGTEYLWMGDIWGSASDNVKGHDYQYWSSPLRFDEAGWIEPLEYERDWSLSL